VTIYFQLRFDECSRGLRLEFLDTYQGEQKYPEPETEYSITLTSSSESNDTQEGMKDNIPALIPSRLED